MSEYAKIETLFERDMATFKVDPSNLKNPTYNLIKSWDWTEKVDGTNIRCIWHPFTCKAGHPVFSDSKFCGTCGTEIVERVPNKVVFGGKTDNAQIHADLIKWLYENVSAQKLAAIFPESSAVIYGEGYGAGIQKGGGDYSPVKKIIVFDVFVFDAKNRLGGWWLNWENTVDVAKKLGLETVPMIMRGSLQEAAELVRAGFKSHCSINNLKQAEGLVGRTSETLFDKKGHRLITKIKTKDF